MKKFSFLFLLTVFSIFSFSGCEKKPIGTVEEMHWDRDMCERCKMAISERKFAAQIIDPKIGKVYKFDDIGCALLWMEETGLPWKEKAVIWVTDAKNGEWINARAAKYVYGAITPMAYGFAAYSEKTLPAGAEVHDLEYITKKIIEIEKENNQKVKVY